MNSDVEKNKTFLKLSTYQKQATQEYCRSQDEEWTRDRNLSSHFSDVCANMTNDRRDFYKTFCFIGYFRLVMSADSEWKKWDRRFITMYPLVLRVWY